MFLLSFKLNYIEMKNKIIELTDNQIILLHYEHTLYIGK